MSLDVRPPAEHSVIAPSSLARTVQCPGSVRMQQAYPRAEDGPESLEGTAVHWAYAEIVDGGAVAVGQIAPNGVTLDDEMIESAQLMADTVSVWPFVRVEQRLSIVGLHAECFGTPDAFAWQIPRRWLKVGDLKNGHGFVEEFENWQLMAYAWGAMEAEGITGAEEYDLVVELTIVQPRSYHRGGSVRTWKTTGGDLRAYRNIASAAAHEALGPNPKTVAGPECKHCTARHACPTLQAAALDLIDTVGKAEPLDLPTQQAAHELRRLEYALAMAQARASGLEAQLLAAAKGGQVVPFYRIEASQGREAWAKPVDELFAVGDLFGLQLRKAPAPITPAQARKLGFDLAGFSARPAGALKLVAESPFAAAKVFGQSSTPTT